MPRVIFCYKTIISPDFAIFVSATGTLKDDHVQIRRLQRIVDRCQRQLYEGADIPFDDIGRICTVISEFVDSVHYSREEDSYFACVAGYGTLKDEIRRFMIEHEFGRRIASKAASYLEGWRAGKDNREPVARYLRTYSIYLGDHLAKEDAFFDEAESVLSEEEERAMYEQFRAAMATAKKMDIMIKHLDYLESREWFSS